MNTFLPFVFLVLAAGAAVLAEESYDDALMELVARGMAEQERAEERMLEEKALLEKSEKETRELSGNNQERAMRRLNRLLQRKGLFTCKEKQDSCSGIVACCGNMQCYWENGYSLLKPGVCVDCVKRGQSCQRDAQCCEGNVCQKGKFGYTDGTCLEKRPAGGECHENDQCASGNCVVSPWQIASRVEGQCA